MPAPSQGPDDLVIGAPQLDLFCEDLSPGSDHAFDRPFGHGEARRPLAPETLGLSEMVQARKEPVDAPKSLEEANEELRKQDQEHDELSKWQLPSSLPVKTKRQLVTMSKAMEADVDMVEMAAAAKTTERATEREPAADEERDANTVEHQKRRQLDELEAHAEKKERSSEPKEEHAVSHENQRKSERGGLHHAARHSQQKKQVDVLEDDGSELASVVY